MMMQSAQGPPKINLAPPLSAYKDLTDTKFSTKGVLIQIGAADRTPRETLEERLEKTPSNAHCFAQGSS